MHRFLITLSILLLVASPGRAPTVSCEEVVYGGQMNPLYPAVLKDQPDLPNAIASHLACGPLKKSTVSLKAKYAGDRKM